MERQGKKPHLFILDDRLYFPPVAHANSDGLLAMGGDLSPERLLKAYKSGIFPWFNDDSLILWWSPDPRMVLFPEKIKVSKSMRQVLKRNLFRLTVNTCFEKVMLACAKVDRKGQEGTWITNDMLEAYKKLHEMGFAKSYEVWQGDELVGGLYGIDLGHVFCGESMFSVVSNASKYAFIQLAKQLEEQDYLMIDCQIYTEHLESLGAEVISREDFIAYLERKI